MRFNTLFVAAWALSALAAQALQISAASPQGEVPQVRQVVLRFDADATRFGDARAAAPASVRCTDEAAGRGTGRWNNAREWVWQFENDLPPGQRCEITASADLQLTGRTRFSFQTGGPVVRSSWPYGGNIDEEQFFVLRLNGPATLDSVRANVWCAVEGLGERVPVRLVEGAERTALLKARRLDDAAAKAPLAVQTLACNRRLPPSAKLQLVYGPGVATPGGVANRVERRFDFTVREPFSASFSCERENAQADCLPIRPLRLQFSAPVPRAQAEAVRLQGGGRSLSPQIDDNPGDALVDSLRFDAPFAERSAFTLALPADMRDASGRALANAGQFPLPVRTGAMPPLAKFASSPFGIVERLAEPGGPALLPVTVRRIESAPRVASLRVDDGQVAALKAEGDAQIQAWFRKLQRYDRFQVERKQAAADLRQPLPPVIDPDQKDWVQPRMLLLLAGQPAVQTLALPAPSADDPRPFEVIGLPLPAGFHVVEISSRRLGQALLDERYGDNRTMVVRSAALVTNLAVHFKLGRENALAWVTALDSGKPVADAQVRVSDCQGREAAAGRTDARGVVALRGLSPEPPACKGDDGTPAWFVSARARGSDGVDDLAFTFSDWNRGIEPWRFDLPTSQDPQPDLRAHTVLDRTLLRAGETVGMKHLLRTETAAGLAAAVWHPSLLRITHVGSGQKFEQPLAWRDTATGGRSAESQFKLPPAARLGEYEVALADAQRSLVSGRFRVEEFRLPVMEGRITPEPAGPLVAPGSLAANLQINYLAGGGAARLPVEVSALLRERWLQFVGYDAFSFAPPRDRRQGPTGMGDEGEEESAAADAPRVIANKLAVTLDAQGAGRVALPAIEAAPRAQELLLEARYADPNGEIQTLRGTHTVWPAGVVAGLKTEGWVSARGKVQLQALALDLAGRPKAGVALDVRAQAHVVTTSRKRMVGGFYTYDSKSETKDLGRVCSGKSDARGLLLCEAQLGQSGEVELVVTAKDEAGRSVQAAGSVWVTRQGELWFGGENHDRIDLLPEQRTLQAGDTATLQVRMPFRQATALVTVEREGLLWHEVVELSGQDPTVKLKVQEGWGPNVYVSALVLRGRLREVPWYSFFTWGYKAPRSWWQAFWYDGREVVAPTALVDLSKPAFRLGVAELRVGTAAHRIDVQLQTDQASYQVRGQAQVRITAKLPDGKPAAHAEVALAAVDQALLELAPNDSWDLLGAMLQRRAWGVQTATAQMEIIGRRHYGRKAVPAGGGGGRNPTRELLDTLLLWNPRVVLDAQGQATVTVPLNDALTSFRIVAVADSGQALFGTGQATIRTTQDLQIISGLPPLVREEDRYRAQFTLRNTTAKAMRVELKPRATLLDLPAQTLEIPPNEAREAVWDVVAPAQLAHTRTEAILWEIEAHDSASGARDALKVSQRIVPAVPVSVQQATLVQLAAPFTQAVQPPADALASNGRPRGGLQLALQARLADGLPGVRDWFLRYPYSCLEQSASRALGLEDAAMWQGLLAQLPTYLDSDGLAHYFPPRDGEAARGSDTLTAYLLSASHEAAALDPRFALPEAQRRQMEDGLLAFVEGRIQRNVWSPRADLDVRKLAALEALSRSGRAPARLLASITLAPEQWPTHALLDWLAILQRVQDVPQRAQRLEQAQQLLRARLAFAGTRLGFSTEPGDAWWWLMASTDTNAARLLLAALNQPDWQSDLGRLASGLIARQQRGAWATTTANLWGSLALRRFSAQVESEPVAGSTRATLGSESVRADWPGTGAPPALFLPWPGTGPAQLQATHEGTGKPWLTLQSLAAVDLKTPFDAGYRITRTVTPVEQAQAGRYSRGDILRITLAVTAAQDMTWVVLSDPVPGGATILGSGLGRDSAIATQGERQGGQGWPAFEERSFEAFRSYYAFLPKGQVTTSYTVRLNNVGDFALPPTRVEAMYAPEVVGLLPNGRVKVEVR